MTRNSINLIAIDKNYVNDMGIGIVAGLVFIFMNILNPSITIGIPKPIYLGVVGSALVVIVLAPILEEFIFVSVLYTIGLQLINDDLMKKIVVFIIIALAFSTAHYTVYTLALISAYVGAFIFRIIALFMADNTNSVIGNLVFHGIVNAYLFGIAYNLFSVGV